MDRSRAAAVADWTLYGATGQRKYLNEDERRRFIAAAGLADPKVRTLCLTLAYTGCRISEALSLTGGDIEVSSGLIAVRSLKKRGRLLIRQIPAPAALLTELARVHRLCIEDGTDPRLRLWRWGRTRAWQLVKGVHGGCPDRSAARLAEGSAAWLRGACDPVRRLSQPRHAVDGSRGYRNDRDLYRCAGHRGTGYRRADVVSKTDQKIRTQKTDGPAFSTRAKIRE